MINNKRIFTDVFRKVDDWFGEPNSVIKTNLELANNTINMLVCSYKKKHTLSLTIGASLLLIPHSDHRYKSGLGMRHEYIIHHEDSIIASEISRDILKALAQFPIISHTFVYSGAVIFLGNKPSILKGEAEQYILLTDPFFDDPLIYSDMPKGQIKAEDYTVQFLWAIPIYKSEFEYIRRMGIESFENTFLDDNIDYSDWSRSPLI